MMPTLIQKLASATFVAVSVCNCVGIWLAGLENR